jgi:hypothetical protein
MKISPFFLLVVLEDLAISARVIRSGSVPALLGAPFVDKS